MNFKEWIQRYENEPSDIGLLAKDIAMDKDFPNADNIEILREYLESKKPTAVGKVGYPDYSKALLSAWCEYCRR